MNVIVNGTLVEIEPQPGEMLADLLRERLGLTGTKIGCNESECGACTVLVDGEPVLSCNYPAAKASGKEVTTIEGLASLFHTPLHPLQQAFILHGAVQCGYCIPGQIMTAFALLQSNPDPSEEEIRHALKDTLCRCGGYPSIIRAVLAASHVMRRQNFSGQGEPMPAPELPLSDAPLGIIGSLQIRPDAVAKVTGEAKFTDDLKFANMLHARVKRAGVPHAIVRRTDVSSARSLPGVVSVLTAEDVPCENDHGLVIYDWPVMVGVGERVRYVGDAIAIVAAETREIPLAPWI